MTLIDVPILPMAEVASRNAAGLALLKAARENPQIWLLTADLMHSTGVEPFTIEFPNRYINVGVAEQTLMGLAAGMAVCGKIPVAATFACFASMRTCEQVRTDIAYPNLNVKLYSTHSGMSLGPGGTTHHATEDVAIMRAIANMTVIVPADVHSIKKAIEAALKHQGPVYLRLRRGNDPVIYPEDFEFEIGVANILRQGRDVTLIGYGRMVAECVIAAELLARSGIEATVIDMHTVKPVDVHAIEQASHDTKLIVTVEDHNIIGGLGSAVAEVLSEIRNTPRLKRLGIRDTYAGIGPEDGLLTKHGLDASSITEEVKRSL